MVEVFANIGLLRVKVLELLLVMHGHDIGRDMESGYRELVGRREGLESGYRELVGRGEGYWNRDIGN